MRETLEKNWIWGKSQSWKSTSMCGLFARINCFWDNLLIPASSESRVYESQSIKLAHQLQGRGGAILQTVMKNY